MYQPQHFREDRLEIQHGFIRACPLGLLVSVGESGLIADPVPFVLDEAASEQGTLRCHLARANPHWRSLRDASECLVVFQGPEAYISPSFYPTKRETGAVVPTWNYVTVHAWGQPTVIEDEAWLRSQVNALTDAQEHRRAEPWEVSDAPPAFIAGQLRGIVGIEIAIARIEGKWKLSQNRAERDRAGVVAGLRTQEGKAQQLADAVQRRMTEDGR